MYNTIGDEFSIGDGMVQNENLLLHNSDGGNDRPSPLLCAMAFSNVWGSRLCLFFSLPPIYSSFWLSHAPRCVCVSNNSCHLNLLVVSCRLSAGCWLSLPYPRDDVALSIVDSGSVILALVCWCVCRYWQLMCGLLCVA